MPAARSRPESPFILPAVRKVGPARPLAWIHSGWQDIRANPIASLAYGLLFAIGGDLILIFSWRSPYLFTAAVSGFFLIAPLLAGGLYEISRRQESGLSSTFIDSLSAWSRNGQSVALFGLMLALLAIIWERTSAVFFAVSIPGLTPDIRSFVTQVVLNTEFLGLTLAWTLAGGVLAAGVFSVSAVSIPMLIDRDTDVVTAMATSVRTVLRNPQAMAIWAILVVLITLAGFASLLFGLIVLMPLLGHATWHAYRELVE